MPKECSVIFSPFLTQIWSNETISEKTFPTNLKLADVTLVFKKKDSTLAENYRPVSILPKVSKRFEKLMQKQINNCINKLLSPFLCGSKKGYSTQFALTTLIEKWKICLDQKGYTGAVLMELPEAFDTIKP